jgi:[protein-PII] uridylyltransferase
MSTRERPGAVARLLEELSALDRAYSPGHHGRWSAARRASFVDGCLQELFADAGSPDGVAVVALGGYGRGRLSPRSDLDVLIAHDGERPAEIQALTEQLLYPLWDAGFRVGHGVRTAAESFELAASRLDARTAILDGRLVAGAATVWDETSRAVVAEVRADLPAFAGALVADAAARSADGA